MQEIFNSLFRLLIAVTVLLFCTVISKEVVPYLRQRIAASIRDDGYDTICKAVKFAEQTLTGGSVKKDTVMKLLLAIPGMPFSEDELNMLIEAAVYTLKHGKIEEDNNG